jgi:hypothetical protein
MVIIDEAVKDEELEGKITVKDIVKLVKNLLRIRKEILEHG